MWERATTYLLTIGEELVEYLGNPSVLYQLAIIAILFLPAWLVSLKVEPRLEARAREIKGRRGLLRVIASFLRRMEWLFFALFLGIAYFATSIAGWPGRNHLIYSAMLLSGTWLAINVVSNVIRSRLIAKTFAWAAWIYVATAIFDVTDDIVDFLGSTSIGLGERITLLVILKGILLFGALLWASIMFGGFAEKRISGIEELTPSLRVLIGKIVRISLIVLAVMIGMSTLNLDLTALTVLSGAVGVGLGFGLQKVVSNFISGIIILMDESIKPGDTITLGETFGWIRLLRGRYVSVVTRDGREYLIPNDDFITNQVVNWSYSSREVRVKAAVGVSYSSDIDLVMELLYKAVEETPRILKTPKPRVNIMAFGNSSVDFEVRFWITDPEGNRIQLAEVLDEDA